MGEVLKPCPMCGCAATFVKHSAGMPGTQGFDKWDAVACKHCRTTVGACDRRFRCREDAAAAWNRRVPDAAKVRRDALEEAASACDVLNAAYTQQANGGDNTGASDHRAQAAEECACDIRSLAAASIGAKMGEE